MTDVEARRGLRVVEAFAAQPPSPPAVRLCGAASELLGSDGVAMSIGARDDVATGGLLTVCATGGGREGEAGQFDVGEGPSYTAHRAGRPVLVPDLEHDDTWPAFAEVVAPLGLRAVFAFPLRSGPRCLGAMTLYQQVAGQLTCEQYGDALVLARSALELLTSLQAERPSGELDQAFIDPLAGSVEVFQASGVVAVQLRISVGDALAVLRAHAFVEGCSLTEVATQVVHHRIRLGPLRD